MNNEINNFLNLLNSKYYENYIQQKITYFTYFLKTDTQNQNIFNNHKYNPEIIKPFSDDIITQFFMLSINKCIENDKKTKSKSNNNILFIAMIIGKLYEEKIINKNVILKISTYLLEN